MADEILVRALTQHDKVRRSTDIPLFYGRKDKDTISPHQLLERINRAKRVANWPDYDRVCDEFFLCL
jgi:coproporphyrinogen III oxidase